jgi:predicted O-methyltransferase YrrM
MDSAPTVAPTPVLSRVARIPSYIRAIVGMLRPSFISFFRVWMRDTRHTRGWLRIPDGYLLYRLARDPTSSGDVVEIGSAWGRSTICLAAGSRSVEGRPVVAIDPHTGDTWFLEESGLDRIDSFTEFSSNVARAGLSDWVAPMVMTSEAAAAEFPDGPIRLLFIDGLHTLEGVERDIDDWVPRVAEGGVIVFDDYDNVADGVGVREAVDRLLASGMVDPHLRRAFNLVWTYRLPGPATG